jgi:hypothetical protein
MEIPRPRERCLFAAHLKIRLHADSPGGKVLIYDGAAE